MVINNSNCQLDVDIRIDPGIILSRHSHYSIQAIHNVMMLSLTVSCIAIANDRINAIPEAAMLATPLMSDIIPQVSCEFVASISDSKHDSIDGHSPSRCFV